MIMQLSDPGTLSRDEIQRNIELLKSRNGMERQRARIALVTIGTQAIDFFAELATHPQDTVRWEAVKGLGQLMDPVTAPILVNALEDENTAVRWLAAEGLVKLNKNGLIPLLEALTRQKITIFLREGAHHVIKSLARKYPSEEIRKLLKSLDLTTNHSDVPILARNLLEILSAGK
jgi:HEAT repeat protein